ncbi:hypothetical protein QAD02_022522 [Eretmocerus hayati]|uniref:Uncharacterized protein n=1 Tax=Eretmocerus hayati TaxID=131215 RepID=A0ACC2PUU2_9HYME|nr:hypothetical protein QAD02_022522 [Eretmocerus hayati]
MRWMPVLLFLLGFWMGFKSVGCADLLDLYVQHMDEAMGTRARKIMGHERQPSQLHQNRLRQMPRVILQRRQTRSVIESPVYKVADPVRQSLASDFRPKGKKITREKVSTDFFDQAWQNSDDTYFSFKNHQLQSKTSPPSLGQKEIVSDYQTFPFFEGTFLPRTPKKGRTPKKFEGARKKNIYAMKKRLKRNDDPVMIFPRYEKLDEDGDITLEWDPNENENVTFRLTAKTLGYVGLGFNDRNHMMGADIILAWVDDHTHEAMLLDSHGVDNANAASEMDRSQDVHLISGFQNLTHTVIIFTRKWHACDPQDRSLTGDTIRILWAIDPNDPEVNSARFDGEKRGGRAIRLKSPAPHPPPLNGDPDLITWDVKLNQFTVSNSSDTIYWCKIFKIPKNRKHHMIGYTPLIEKANEAVVHHLVLYECSSTAPILSDHAKIVGAHCYSPTMPHAWDSCLQPVLAWARGSRGEWLPEHVGVPIAERLENSYYMLEVHYNNKLGRQVVDSSGVRLHLTPNLRSEEAGILVAGVAVSPMHMVPPQQKEYATAGYCTSQCTNQMFDDRGINVVSVVLHSHLAGRRLSLKHIREGQELSPIVEDRRFDFEYQQPYTLKKEVQVLPGDELVAECVYDTRDRQRATYGGYAAYQEMCLAFIVHYPRTPLASCYSMTPVKEFFNALNVQSFKDRTMDEVEKLFFASSTTASLPVSPNHHAGPSHNIRSNEFPEIDIIKQTKATSISKGEYIDYDDIFDQLIIEKPEEFKDHTLSNHISALAWNDSALSKSIENSLYHGKYVTFCRTREDKIPQAASIQMFPNYTALPMNNETFCKEYRSPDGFSSSAINLFSSFVVVIGTISIAVHL